MKNLIKASLAYLLMFSLLFCVMPTAYAKQNIDSGLVTFEDYEGTWNGDDKYNAPGGSKAGSFGVQHINAYAGITSGTPASDASNGTSVKMILKPYSSYSYYSTFLHEMTTNVYNTIHIKYSFLQEETPSDGYIGSYVRLRETSSNLIKDTVQFASTYDGQEIWIAGYSMGVTWYPGQWYNVDYIFNINTNDYKASVADSSGNIIATKEGRLSGNVKLNYIKQVQFIAGPTSSTLVSKKYGEQIRYFDNIEIYTDWEYISPGAAEADFAIDKDNSTNGKEAKVCEEDEVIVKFTNDVDTESFSDGMITFPYLTQAPEFTYEFTDSKTLRLSFEKTAGEHYHILFTDVKDTSGNTLTDYVEFDVKKPDFEMSAIIFKNASGEAVSLLESGNITASFDAVVNNETTKNIFFALAQYQDGALEKVTADEFLVTSSSEIKLTADVDSLYTGNLVAYIWEAGSLTPLCKPLTLKKTTTEPIAILKLDDLNHAAGRLEAFDESLEITASRGIKTSFGLMGYCLDSEGMTSDQKLKIKSYNDNPLVELWFHGYGSTFYYASHTSEEQNEQFKAGVESAESHGISYKTFGPPSSSFNKDTLELMDKTYTNFKVIMCPSDKTAFENCDYTPQRSDFISLWKSMPAETKYNDNDALYSFEDLKANWNAAKTNGNEYNVIQIHPWKFANECSDGRTGIENFELFIDWLIEEGVVFMTPSEYAAYSLNKH